MRTLLRGLPALLLVALSIPFWLSARETPPADAAIGAQVGAPPPQASPTPAVRAPSPRTPVVQPPSPRGPTPTPQVVVPTPPPLPPPPAGRYFAESGFSVRNDSFWEYFNARGGVRTFGFPISREFLLSGARVQIFQRQVMQQQGSGVGLLNLLDPGLMPYTRINGSVFPDVDEAMKNRTPAVGTPNYDTAIATFIEQNAPETWNNLPVRYWTTFRTTVPEGSVPPNLVTLANLEIWGSVISPPAYDPSNSGFVYQRFQRNIMHYQESCRCTEGLLMAQWFKTLITGDGLPGDLAAEAQGSPYALQYNNAMPNGLNRPAALPNTDMRYAFEREVP
jgi:hypothetical protein